MGAVSCAHRRTTEKRIRGRGAKTIWSTVGGLGTQSLFFSFILPSVFHSVVLPLLVHPLPGLGWKVSPSAPIRFFFTSPSLVLSFLFLALLRADPVVTG